ncbi:hypothetical protein [Jiella mangrovi]|uniref:hypothetical protein n=1 Tax=Jiella mangrovi TaxID=2821407 RepID=UPI003CC91F0D
MLYALKYGFVHQPSEPATRAGYNRYRMEGKTPNSGARSIGVVAIPDRAGCLLTIVTVMWLDEFETRSGSIIGE